MGKRKRKRKRERESILIVRYLWPKLRNCVDTHPNELILD